MSSSVTPLYTEEGECEALFHSSPDRPYPPYHPSQSLILGGYKVVPCPRICPCPGTWFEKGTRQVLYFNQERLSVRVWS